MKEQIHFEKTTDATHARTIMYKDRDVGRLVWQREGDEVIFRALLRKERTQPYVALSFELISSLIAESARRMGDETLPPDTIGFQQATDPDAMNMYRDGEFIGLFYRIGGVTVGHGQDQLYIPMRIATLQAIDDYKSKLTLGKHPPVSTMQ